MSSERTFIFNGKKDIIEFVIQNGYISIGDYAFCKCSSLTNITIPNSVKKIGEHAFEECSSLTKAYVPSIFKNIKNVLPENCKLEEQKYTIIKM